LPLGEGSRKPSVPAPPARPPTRSPRPPRFERELGGGAAAAEPLSPATARASGNPKPSVTAPTTRFVLLTAHSLSLVCKSHKCSGSGAAPTARHGWRGGFSSDRVAHAVSETRARRPFPPRSLRYHRRMGYTVDMRSGSGLTLNDSVYERLLRERIVLLGS